MDKIKNQTILDNCKDPLTNYYVKKIFIKKISKLGRDIWYLGWEYYRDRYKISIFDFYRKNFGKELKITFSGYPQPKIIIVKKEDLVQLNSDNKT